LKRHVKNSLTKDSAPDLYNTVKQQLSLVISQQSPFAKLRVLPSYLVYKIGVNALLSVW